MQSDRATSRPDKAKVKDAIRTSLASMYDQAAAFLGDNAVSKVSFQKEDVLTAVASAFRNKHVGSRVFMVGTPIRFSAEAKQFKESILHERFVEAFENQKSFLIMATEADALAYARATRRGNFYQDTECSQSPVIELKILKSLNELGVKQVDVSIRDGSLVQERKVLYINADSTYVRPVSAKLKVETATYGKKEYPVASLTSVLCFPIGFFTQKKQALHAALESAGLNFKRRN